MTKPEHVRAWFGAKELEVCETDFRVGGKYHFVGFVMDGDTALPSIDEEHWLPAVAGAEEWAAGVPVPGHAIDDQTAVKVTGGTGHS